MKMIRKQTVAKQIDPEIRRELLQIFLQPAFVMVEVLPRDKIIAHEKAPSDGTAKHVSDSDFARIKNFRPTHPCHHAPHWLPIQQTRRRRNFRYRVPSQ
ncbi:hypothetical protein [Neorhodopirellula pilleata]|uniref:hypothetical protein n=1 Tax=Neorhodopirellula pilleata TaxID=2714738 RepID=UPI0018CF1D46|nr:hypothetical protein [Neorhodopirellula pilleata]